MITSKVRILALYILCTAALLGQPYTITTIAGGGTSRAVESAALDAQIVYAGTVAVDTSDTLYIADGDKIRRIKNGIITTIAGTGTSVGTGYGNALGVDFDGNLYIAESDFSCQVVKFSNGTFTRVAGDGRPGGGFGGDGGPATAARLNYVKGAAGDRAGNLYIGDSDNRRIRKVTNGIITTVFADTESSFFPTQIVADFSGNVYIADPQSSRIWKLTGGKRTAMAGSVTNPNFGGDNGPATSALLNHPSAVAVDSAGNIYIADTDNDRIRKVSNGVITTIAGDGTRGFGGDGGPATQAQLNRPRGVAVDSAGNVYIGDSGRIRKLTPAFATKNAASYSPNVVAPDMIAFGESASIRSPELIVANDWPASVGGASVSLTDFEGRKHSAPMYYAAPGAIAFRIPNDVALGPATVELTVNGETNSSGFKVERISPGLFTANSTGSGVAAGFWVRVAPDGKQSQGYLFDPAAANRVAVSVDLAAPGDRIFLSLYGTGFRNANHATAKVGGEDVPVDAFAADGTYPGEDVVNIGPLPRGLAGRGEIDVVVTFDEKVANRVTVNIR